MKECHNLCCSPNILLLGCHFKDTEKMWSCDVRRDEKFMQMFVQEPERKGPFRKIGRRFKVRAKVKLYSFVYLAMDTVSGQLHALIALPPVKESRCPLGRRLGGLQS